VRLDPRRSPAEELPPEVRGPLLAIYRGSGRPRRPWPSGPRPG
jgi:hypothetical protein